MQKIYNCLLIGETGMGKSSFGNFLLGIKDAFGVSEDSSSCTKETIRKISQLDPEISVIDTPGLLDSNGNDKVHYEQMLNIIKQIGHLHFILILLNYTKPRFSSSIKHMIKFLCNLFPKNFAHHVGIIFTYYDHDYQVKINKSQKDPREKRSNFVKDIMKFISQTTNEALFLGPPVYFLDSYIEDDNSIAELNKLIAFVKNLKPIENIRENCNLKYMKEEDEIEERKDDIVEGDYIVTYIKKYRRKKYTDYNNIVTYGDWGEPFSIEKTNYRRLPVRGVYLTSKEPKEPKKPEPKKPEPKPEPKEKPEENNTLSTVIKIAELVFMAGITAKKLKFI